MNTARVATAMFAGHILVASVAWTMGYLAGRLIERRNQDVIDLCDRVQGDVDEFIQLISPTRPYDWRLDGECVEPRRVP